MTNYDRLEKLKEYLYNEILEVYGWLPPKDDYTNPSKIEEYKQNFIEGFKYNFITNINESIEEINERYEIIKKVETL